MLISVRFNVLHLLSTLAVIVTSYWSYCWTVCRELMPSVSWTHGTNYQLILTFLLWLSWRLLWNRLICLTVF